MPWAVIIPAVASVIGGGLSAAGGQAAADAQKDASRESIALQKSIYQDQRGLARPGYMTGGAATNKLAALFGIAPQDYAAAYGGSSGGGFGNPYAQSDQWSSYLQAQPDVVAYWNGNDKLRSMFNNNINEFAQYHFANNGQREGWSFNENTGWAFNNQPVGLGAKSNMPVGGTQQEGTTASASNPLQEFYDSPYNKLATTLSNSQIDTIKGNLGASGKAISGAAEGRYAKTLAGNQYSAFGDYTNALRSLGNMQQTASSQISGAAGQYGANAGNAIQNAGNAQANALSSAYQGWGQGISGALGTVNDYGKAQKWWS